MYSIYDKESKGDGKRRRTRQEPSPSASDVHDKRKERSFPQHVRSTTRLQREDPGLDKKLPPSKRASKSLGIDHHPSGRFTSLVSQPAFARSAQGGNGFRTRSQNDAGIVEAAGSDEKNSLASSKSDKSSSSGSIKSSRSHEAVEDLPFAQPVTEEDEEQRINKRYQNQVSGVSISVATQSSRCIDWSNKRVRACLVIGILLICGAIGGGIYAIVASQQSSSPEIPRTEDSIPEPPPTPTASPTSFPTASPTSIVLEQLGQTLRGEMDKASLSGPRGERFFGWSVDMSTDGMRLAVTAPYCPCVYIYDYDMDIWLERAKISNGPGIIDHIALSGNGKVIAIGMPNERNSESPVGGKVQVFAENASAEWQRMGNAILGQSPVDNIGGFTDKKYSWSRPLSRDSYDSRTLALSENGQVMAVGSPGANYVRVLRYDTSTNQWTKLGKREFLVGESGGDKFGNSVDLSADGKRIIVGSPDNIGNARPWFNVYNGQVRVYQYIEEENSWHKIGQDIDGVRGFRYHGVQAGSTVSISADGSIIAVGGNLKASSEEAINILGEDDGHARIFKYHPARDEWRRLGNTINVFNFGLSSQFAAKSEELRALVNALDSENFPIVTRLSGDGNRLAIGVLSESLDGLTGHGVVRLYELRSNIWKVVADPIEGAEKFDHSGRSIALSFNGSRLAIGSPEHSGEGRDQGQVRIFQVEGTTDKATSVPTSAPSHSPMPSIQRGNATITIVLSIDRTYNLPGIGWSLQCDGNRLASVPKGNVSDQYVEQTFQVGDGSVCQLSFLSSRLSYSVYYGNDSTRQDSIIVAGGEWDYFFQNNATFHVLNNTARLTVELQMDSFPEEIGCRLLCDGSSFLDVPSGSFDFSDDNDLVGIPVMGISEGSTCDFSITDSFGDGLGYYKIYYGLNTTGEQANLLVVGNGNFGNMDEVSFVVAPPEETITSNPTVAAPPTSTVTISPTVASPTALPTVLPLMEGPFITVSVVLVLDFNSRRAVGWKLQCGGVSVASLPIGTFASTSSYEPMVEKVQVAEGAQCTFILSDSGGDGFARKFDGGLYRIYYGEDTSDETGILLVGGSKFDFVHIAEFTVSASEDPMTPTPTYSPPSPPTKDPSNSLSPTSVSQTAPTKMPQGEQLTSSPTSVIPILLVLQLDRYGGETGWSLSCDDRILKDVPPGTYAGENQITLEEEFFVHDGAVCLFTIIDTYNDGICCLHGNGYYRIYYGNEEGTILAEGDEFETEEKVTFTVSDAQ